MEKLHESVSNQEDIKFKHFSVFPGIINSIENDKDFGKPAAFFVREDGCDNTRIKGTILNMISDLQQDESVLNELGDFIAGVDGSDAAEANAQLFCEKINDPDFQKKVFALHEQKMSALKKLEEIKSEAALLIN
ncbi:MAG: hypothetical protein WCG07_01560 [Candidatus Taylorbacteria bacterium]